MALPIQSVPIRNTDVLPAEGVEIIHEKSLEILSDFGIKVKHDGALELLESNGCDVDRETQFVHFPPSLVEECVDSTPDRFTLHARNPDNDIEVGDEGVRTPVYGPPNIRTFDDGRRNSTITDYETFMKLVQQEDPTNCTGYSVCEPHDVPQEVKHVEMLRRSLTLTDKPVMGSTYGEERARTSLDMVGLAVDNPDLSKPYVAGLVNTVPPRQWDTRMTGGLMEFARRGQPVVIAPGVMAAASGPASLAGSIALSNAEALVGIVIGQLVNPGTPLVFAIRSSPIDIRHGSYATGSPEGRIVTAVAAQMARYYDLPVRCHGSITDAKTINSQSGSESMLSMLTSMSYESDFTIHAAGMLESYTTASPEKFVLDCERIRYIEHFRKGLELSDDTFAMEVIEDIEPGGQFLDQQHTLTHGRSDHYFPELFDRRSHDDWHDAGEPDPFEAANERVKSLVESYDQPPMDDDVANDLEAYADAARAEILDHS